MAKRQNIFIVSSDSVQGEGSFVKVRALKYGQSIAAGIEAEEQGGTVSVSMNRRVTEEIITNHVIEWDWVGDDDQPLPLPKDDPSVFAVLTVQEVAFLTEAITGTAEKKG